MSPKHDQYIQRVAAINQELGTKFSVIGNYVSALDGVEHGCGDCDYKWIIKPNNFYNLKGCPRCRTGKTFKNQVAEARTKLLGYAEDLRRVYEHRANVRARLVLEKDPRKRAQGARSVDYETTLTCLKCEHEWSPAIGNALSGSGCPACTGRGVGGKKFDTDSFRKAMLRKQPDLDVSAVFYKRAHDLVIFQCPRHGQQIVKATVITGKLDSELKFVCGRCNDETARERTNAKYDRDWYIDLLSKFQPSLSACDETVYTGMHSPITLQCVKHDRVSRPHAQNFLGLGCPRCRKSVSIPHQRVCEMLDSLDIRHEVNNRRVLKPLEIDVFVPDRKFGIEINGIYWHKDEELPHRQKLEMAAEAGLRLMQFLDTEILSEPAKVKSLIQQSLGKSQVAWARKLQVISVANSVAKRFYDLHHLQGYRNQRKTAINLALVDGKRLVQMMSFDQPLFDKKVEWELTRLVTRMGWSVVGGSERLWSHFRKQADPTSVLSYCDARLFTGRVYETLGFERVKFSKPNYWYVKGGEILSRYQCQKHKLEDLLDHFEPEWSERENMLHNGYSQIFDCGNYVYHWNKD